MKKILVILLSAVSLFAAPKSAKKINIDDNDEKAMSHINYIQYSLNKIRFSRSKATINAELDAILNTINPTSLKYDALIEAYQNLTQSTLMGLKLNIEQEEALQAEIHNRRSNAIYSTFEGLGSAFLVPNPLSLGMAALQAGFNYARTQSEITNDSLKNANKLDAEAIRIIDVERIGIFLSAAKIFKDKKCENTHFINETMMQSLSQITYELDNVAKLDSIALKASDNGFKNIHMVAQKAITYLSEDDIYELFKFFLPYHLTLLKAHYFLTEIDNSHYHAMDSIFTEIVKISNGNYRRFYQKNDYLKEAAQYMILAEMQKGPYANKLLIMNDHIKKMEENIQPTLENKINHKYFLTSVYEYLDQHDLTLKCLDYIHDVGAEDMNSLLMRSIITADCRDPDSESCKRIESLQKRKTYTEEAKLFFNKVKVSKDNGFWVIKSPVALDGIVAECFVSNQHADPADNDRCNSEVKQIKEHETKSFYVYYTPSFKDGKNIYIKFSMMVKDLDDKWAFWGVIKQKSDTGDFSYEFPENIAIK